MIKYTSFLELTAAKLFELQEATKRVRELHKPYQMSIGWVICVVCREMPSERGNDYPCSTIKALDGEQ